MTRLSFRLTEDLKRRTMAVAAVHGIFSYTDVLKQALELWVVVMRNKKRIRKELQIWRGTDEIEADNATIIKELLHEIVDALEEK